ncbi:Protein of unknown function [Leuconostoc citreum LBAE C10]|nr:Protein of unknown function [Leuconostoc citreum LBAE C10]
MNYLYKYMFYQLKWVFMFVYFSFAAVILIAILYFIWTKIHHK